MDIVKNWSGAENNYNSTMEGGMAQYGDESRTPGSVWGCTMVAGD
jgi:hypothetical protein